MSRAPWPGCHGGQKWLGARPAARGPHWSSAHHPPPPSSCPAKVCLYLPPPRRGGSWVQKMPLAPAQVGRLPEQGAGFLGGPCGPRRSAPSSPGDTAVRTGGPRGRPGSCAAAILARAPGPALPPAGGPGAAAAPRPPNPGGCSRGRRGLPSPRRQNGWQLRERTSGARTPAPINTLSPLPRARRPGSNPGAWAAAPSATRGAGALGARPAVHPSVLGVSKELSGQERIRKLPLFKGSF